MIKEIQIHNFKSIQNQSVAVGNCNVIIGANGSGKSNLLESLCFISAAAFNKTDNEYLGNRGVRVTSPELMKSCFDESGDYLISFGVKDEEDSIYKFTMTHDKNPFSSWENHVDSSDSIIVKILDELIEKSKLITETALKKLEDHSPDVNFENYKNENKIELDLEQANKINKSIKAILRDRSRIKEKIKLELNFFEKISCIKDFIIYTPEINTLRSLSKSTSILPVGKSGDGLFNLLSYTKQNSPDKFQEIVKNLDVFIWFEEFNISNVGDNEEESLKIKDRFINLDLNQTSVNEGFLFVLFYLTLIISDQTPQSFAIDNIDTSLNPKLCEKIIKVISNLAIKYNKQIFVTTHNPAVLDGVDLSDSRNKLIICSRKRNGHTQFKIFSADDRPKGRDGNHIKMSEAFMKGLIGGLPKEF